MRKKHHFIKVLTALTAIVVAGVLFCCSKDDPAEDVILKDVSADGTLQEMTGTEPGTAREEASERTVPKETETAGQEIWVYVCGAVMCPGVYSLPQGARMFEAVDLAGGLSSQALPEVLDLASVLADGQKVFIPDKDSQLYADPENGSDLGLMTDTGLSGTDTDGRIDINKASSSELMELPGIGSVKAEAIVAYREQHRFESIEDIRNVPGIKEGLFQKIKDLIRV